MKLIMRGALMAAATMALASPAFAQALDGPALKTMVEAMGYETNVLSSSDQALKFEIKVVTEDFDVPIGVEISGSGRYVWLTALLATDPISDEQAKAFLGVTADLQPTHFWTTTRGSTMAGIALENRGLKPVDLKFGFDKLSSDVVDTADIWDTDS